jgi:hypothetical protein
MSWLNFTSWQGEACVTLSLANVVFAAPAKGHRRAGWTVVYFSRLRSGYSQSSVRIIITYADELLSTYNNQTDTQRLFCDVFVACHAWTPLPQTTMTLDIQLVLAWDAA